MRLTKTYFVFILALLTSGILEVSFLGGYCRDIMLFLSAAWSLSGIYLFSKKKMPVPKITVLFAICLLLNLLYSVSVQGQPVVRTMIAMRDVICFVIILTSLVIVKPTLNEIEKALKPLACAAILLIPVIYFFPSLYASEMALRNPEHNKMMDGMDIIAVWPCHCCAVLYFYFQLEKLKNASNFRDYVPATIFLTYIVLMQNRSTLVFALPCYMIALLKSRPKLKWIILALIVLAGIPATVPVFRSLISETSDQIGNNQYNRWLALAFFFFEEKYDIINILVGHGVPCVGSEHLDSMLYVQDVSNVFISDIGLLGTFYFYGLLFISIIYFLTFKTAFSGKMPLFLRMYALWIICVPIIHCVGLGTLYDSFHIGIFLYLSRELYPRFISVRIYENRKFIVRV